MSAERGLRDVGWTAGLLALALLTAASEPLAAALEFDRSRLLTEPWRALTGHFTHWDLRHLFWDALMFAVLAGVVERRQRSRFLPCLALSALAIPVVLLVAEPGITRYRGLSGIDSALFALAVGVVLRDALAARRRTVVWLLAFATAGFGAKLAYEAVTGHCVFAGSDAFVPVPIAHLVGATAGMAVAVMPVGGLRLRWGARPGRTPIVP